MISTLERTGLLSDAGLKRTQIAGAFGDSDGDGH